MNFRPLTNLLKHFMSVNYDPCQYVSIVVNYDLKVIYKIDHRLDYNVRFLPIIPTQNSRSIEVV